MQAALRHFESNPSIVKPGIRKRTTILINSRKIARKVFGGCVVARAFGLKLWDGNYSKNPAKLTSETSEGLIFRGLLTRFLLFIPSFQLAVYEREIYQRHRSEHFMRMR